MAKKPVTRHPWHPHDWDASDAYAVKALASGTASAAQQKRALAWIIQAAGTYDMEWRESDRASSFAGGKRHVGLQIVKLINLPAEAIKGNPHE
jgi:hypothetical protein